MLFKRWAVGLLSTMHSSCLFWDEAQFVVHVQGHVFCMYFSCSNKFTMAGAVYHNNFWCAMHVIYVFDRKVWFVAIIVCIIGLSTCVSRGRQYALGYT